MEYPITLSDTDKERYVRLVETCGFDGLDFSDVVARITKYRVNLVTRQCSANEQEQRTITISRQAFYALVVAVGQFDEAREAERQAEITAHREQVQEAERLAAAIDGTVTLVDQENETWKYYNLEIRGEWRYCSMNHAGISHVLERLKTIHADIERKSAEPEDPFLP